MLNVERSIQILKTTRIHCARALIRSGSSIRSNMSLDLVCYIFFFNALQRRERSTEYFKRERIDGMDNERLEIQFHFVQFHTLKSSSKLWENPDGIHEHWTL